MMGSVFEFRPEFRSITQAMEATVNNAKITLGQGFSAGRGMTISALEEPWFGSVVERLRPEICPTFPPSELEPPAGGNVHAKFYRAYTPGEWKDIVARLP